MQGLSWLSGNKALAYGAAAVALIVAALLVLLVFRLAFGRRLRMSSARGRQLRLGIVDAFDLDRQRQLVIVRRDNVEHLIMIGGPNDILIESQIVRAEAREPRQRDKDRDKPREKDVEPVQLPLAPALKPTSVEPQLPLPPFVPEVPAEEPVTARQIPPVTPTIVTPAAPTPLQPVARAPLATPIGSRRTPPPVRSDVKPAPAPFPPAPVAPPPLAPEPAEPALPSTEATLPAKPAPGPMPGPQSPSQATSQSFMRWRPNQNPAQPQPRPAGPSFTQPIRRDPSPATPPVPPVVENKPAPELELAPPAPPPALPKEEVAAPAPAPGPEDLMVSLEEEMAKLLGRAPDKP
jgi:flagellar protein FliO/FliZ